MREHIKADEYSDNQSLYEMTNLATSETGLPVVVWIAIKPNEKHRIARILFSDNQNDKMSAKDLVPLSISDNPEIPEQIKNTPGFKLNISSQDFESVRKWVIRNKEGLLKVWEGDISPTQFVIKELK